MPPPSPRCAPASCGRVAPRATEAYAVTGGFAEISATGVSVLAEQAVPLEELTAAVMDALIAEARTRRPRPRRMGGMRRTSWCRTMLALKAATGH